MTHEYTFNVVMSCGGCSGAVTRVLKKLDGVTSVYASLEAQTVSVTTDDSIDYQLIYDTIDKTGKKILGGKTIS